MPFKPGDPKPAGSGRKKGQTIRESVAATCARLNCNPTEALCRIVNDPHTKPELLCKAAAELLQYLAPKLRAIEHSGPGGGPIEFSESARETLASRVAGLAARLSQAGSSQQPDGS